MVHGYQLSPQQKHLWRLLSEPDAPPRYAHLAVSISGPLQPNRLRTALDTVVQTHEILRTRFRKPEELDIALQVPGPPAVVWREKTVEAQRAEPADAAPARVGQDGNDGDTPFGLDLSDGPLIAAELTRHDEQLHTLTLRLPALCADWRALTLLIEQVAAVYEAGEEGQAAEKNDTPLQYADYARWLLDLLESEDAAPGKAFWRERENAETVELPECLRLPKARPGFAHQRLAVAGLAPDSLSSLARLAAEFDMTVPAVCLTVWQILLFRLDGRRRAPIMTAFDGRLDEGLEGTMGPLVRYLPITSALTGIATARAALEAVQRELADADAWQECFEPDWDGASRGAGAPYIAFEERQAMAPIMAAGVRFECLDRWVYNGAHQLLCYCTYQSGAGPNERLQLGFDFNMNQIATGAVTRLAEQFHTLLRGIGTRLDQPIEDLPILPDTERDRVLIAFNEREKAYAAAPVHRLIAKRAATTPDAPALEFEDQSLSYAELERRANGVALRLADRAIGPETAVGLYLERSADWVIAMLGILKAGAIYVPLDPEYPAARIAHILEDARIGLVLTSPDLADKLPATSLPYRSLYLDGDGDGATATPVDRVVHEEQAAYAIYTSGSTGIPKGTLISHRALAQHALAVGEHYELGPGDRILQFAAFNFDASVEQILPPLIHGATVVIKNAQIWGITGIDRRLAELDLTIVNFPTAYWHLLVGEWSRLGKGERARLSRLRLVIAGGDRMLLEPVKRWLASDLADVRLLNAYGPTETTITATTAELNAINAGEIDRIPIGKPLPNRKIYVLDRTGEPAPIGVLGELCIGGEGLARGYLGQPELTATVFRPDGFATCPGQRLYRSGDMARWLPDGSVEFLGRRDNQVKVRGFRIELGEIEGALAAHHAVRQAAVVLRGNDSAQQIAAYIVAEPCPGGDGEGASLAPILREFLRTKLPDYMLPDLFTVLPKLPLLPNGKLDRAALPEPKTSAGTGLDPRNSAPLTAEEEVLAGIWTELLGLQSVSASDNFFDLGGHSLSAMAMVAKIRRAFQVDIDLSWIFRDGTVAQLADTIAATRRAGEGLATPPLEPSTETGPRPLTYAQQRLWVLQQLDPANTAYHVNGALRILGPLDLRAMERAIAAIIERHQVLRTTYSQIDGEPVQTVQPFASWILPIEQLTGSEGETLAQQELDALLVRETGKPFDLTCEPPIRVLLAVRSKSEHILIVVLHHIASDGWSLGIFARELSRCYDAFSHQLGNPLEALPIQYADYAVWQRSWLRDAVLDGELDYWRNQLSGMSRPSLPAAFALQGTRRNLPERLPFEFAQDLSQSLKSTARAHDATLFMLLLAAFKATVFGFTGEADQVVGTDVANRNHDKLTGLIGFFINQLVLRTSLADNPSFSELLGRVRQTAMAAYTHQDLPFEKLVEALNPERERGSSEFFGIKFSLQNLPSAQIILADLIIQPVPVAPKSAKWDLLINLWEQDGALAGMLTYNLDCYDRTRAERLVEAYRTALDRIVADPNCSLSQLTGALAQTADTHAQQHREKRRTGISARFKNARQQTDRQPAEDAK